MKILAARIERYCAFETVELELGDLLILVGKNGSGKSSVIEGLFRFFSEFNGTGGGVPAGFSDYFWFERNTKKPIRFALELELSDNEYRAIFTLPQEALKAIETVQKEKVRTLEISRSIVNLQAGWKTDFIKWGDLTLVKDDQVIGQDEMVGLLTPKEAMSHYTLYFFTPQTFQGSRLLVDTKKKVAYHSTPQVDALASRNLINSSSEAQGQDYKQWCVANNFALNERPPLPQEIDFPIQPISQQLIQSIVTQLANFLRGRMKYLPAARDANPAPGQRVAIIDQRVIDAYKNLFNSTVVEDELRKDKLSERASGFTQKTIMPNPTQILIKDSGLYLPVQFLGGGEQELLYLMWNTQDPGFVYAIEEPENHFHPEFCRKFLHFLREVLCKESQVIVATHSPLIVDKSDVKNNWLVARSGRKSEVTQIQDREKLRLVLAELGMVPSDIFLKDYAIFVEGGTEKEAIVPIFAEMLGFPFFMDHVMVKAVGGDSQFKNYLRIWLDLIEFLPVDYHILLDKSSEKVVLELIKELNVSANKIHVLDRGSIEDYYPADIVKSAMRDLFGVTELAIDNKMPLDHQVEQALKDGKKLTRLWKVRLAQYVAARMSKNQIPEEIRDLITSIGSQITEQQ
jgi:predicted ATPase